MAWPALSASHFHLAEQGMRIRWPGHTFSGCDRNRSPFSFRSWRVSSANILPLEYSNITQRASRTQRQSQLELTNLLMFHPGDALQVDSLCRSCVVRLDEVALGARLEPSLAKPHLRLGQLDHTAGVLIAPGGLIEVLGDLQTTRLRPPPSRLTWPPKRLEEEVWPARITMAILCQLGEMCTSFSTCSNFTKLHIEGS